MGHEVLLSHLSLQLRPFQGIPPITLRTNLQNKTHNPSKNSPLPVTTNRPLVREK